MSKFDKIFDSEDIIEENLSPEEGVAAIAAIAAMANSEEVDVAIIESTIWESEVFDEYSEDEISELVERLISMARSTSLGALFNAAYEVLGDDLVLDAFALAVATFLVDGEVPSKQKLFLKELQEALGIEDEEAQEIIEEVIAELSEEEDEEEYEEIDASDAKLATVAGGMYEDSGDGEWYESPAGNFRVPIPVDLQRGGTISEQEETVGFSDDFGTLLRIDYSPFPVEVEEEIESVGPEAFLKSFLDNYISEGILANIPGSKLLHEEYLDYVGDGAYFAVVDMPQASTLLVQKGDGPGLRGDAYRGFICFVAENFLYAISSQRHFWDGEKPELLDVEVEGIKDKILDFIETIEFAQAQE